MTGGAGTDVPPSNAVDWRVRILLPVALLFVSLLTRTWRIRTRNAGGWQKLRAENKPWVFALWHASLLPAAFQHRRQNIAVLVSQHRDGELIARVLAAWGNTTVRGSTTRGGSRALLAMIKELERGVVVAVTPDGPRGPAQTFQSGTLVAAQRANVPVVPLLIHADRAWRLKSWDRFMIPKFFARITIAYGDPAFVGGSSPRDAAAEAGRFESLMNETQRAADA
ncbi:MAG TPA: lysophospholipid acyltransferase family protein [Gemmatimonadaceae bacterium]|nr:lysophospholipid acyltransferase family protein [Gemmatimonadaceae bacterium]